jgi:hypothetical protein
MHVMTIRPITHPIPVCNQKNARALQHFADQAIIAPLQMHQHGIALHHAHQYSARAAILVCKKRRRLALNRIKWQEKAIEILLLL